jgi:hypothetical protein
MPIQEESPPPTASIGLSPMTCLMIGITLGSIGSVILVAYVNKKNGAKDNKRRLGKPSSGSPPLSSFDEEKAAWNSGLHKNEKEMTTFKRDLRNESNEVANSMIKNELEYIKNLSEDDEFEGVEVEKQRLLWLLLVVCKIRIIITYMFRLLF